MVENTRGLPVEVLLPPPPGLRPAAQRPQPGARRVDEHPVSALDTRPLFEPVAQVGDRLEQRPGVQRADRVAALTAGLLAMLAVRVPRRAPVAVEAA
ncbi:hypothetical protein MAHJHV60_47030 [Mycobacterium avium subsp. hominissuis]